MLLKSLLKPFIPPIVVSLLKRIQPFYGFSGDYATWEEAERALSELPEFANGYAEINIVERVNKAIQFVRGGAFVFERDGVVFNHEAFNFQFLTAFLYVLNKCTDRPMNVLDFGGSLGSSFFQNRRLIEADVCWNIVEQKSFVDMGRQTVPEITFWETLDEFKSSGMRADLLLLSSVLQYFDEPYRYLNMLLSEHISYLLIDRACFNFEDRDRVCLQSVPPSIYSATYPVWLLSKDALRRRIMQEGYVQVLDWDSFDHISLKTSDGIRDIQSRGLLFRFEK